MKSKKKRAINFEKEKRRTTTQSQQHEQMMIKSRDPMAFAIFVIFCLCCKWHWLESGIRMDPIEPGRSTIFFFIRKNPTVRIQLSYIIHCVMFDDVINDVDASYMPNKR